MNGRKMDGGWFPASPPSSCACGREQLQGSPLFIGWSWGGSPTRGHSFPVPTVLAPGRTVLALGSLPGMVFLGEVPAGKGRSLNRWGRPIAFLEGSSGDSPMWPPPKWAPTFLSGHSKPRRAAPSTATGPHLRGTGQENLGGGHWDDVLNLTEPGGTSWAEEGCGWRGSCLPMVVFPGSSPLSPSLLFSSPSILPGVLSWCCAAAGRGRVNAARLRGEGRSLSLVLPTSCSRRAWDAPARVPYPAALRWGEAIWGRG